MVHRLGPWKHVSSKRGISVGGTSAPDPDLNRNTTNYKDNHK